MDRFEIVDIDLPFEEILLHHISSGETHPVDLRGKHLEMARQWSNGQQIEANLIYTFSRYTPGNVLTFIGDVKVLEKQQKF